MLFWATLCILVGLLGMGITGIILVLRISDALADGESWDR